MSESGKKGFFDGRFGKYLLPGILLQSVLIGGGYATGREIVSYGAKFGAKGWIAGIGILIGFAVVAILTFEISRLYKTYDYKSMIKVLIGPAWPLFDVAYVLMMILVIAIMASASGSIVEETTGLNYWFGVVILVAITGGLMFFGDALIERFETCLIWEEMIAKCCSSGSLPVKNSFSVISIIILYQAIQNLLQFFSAVLEWNTKKSAAIIKSVKMIFQCKNNSVLYISSIITAITKIYGSVENRTIDFT